MAALDIARELVKDHEGCRLHPYTDTVGKVTIGYGRNLDDRGVTLAEATAMLDHDLGVAKADAKSWLGESCWEELSDVRKAVLIDLSFNLGRSRLRGFVQLKKALHIGKYSKAADEMLDSRWAGQVGVRAVRLASIMRTGLEG